MTDREAMEQALEALKNNAGEMRVEGAINILERALAQPEQEPVDVGQLEYFGNSVAYIHQKMTAYRNSIDAAWAALWSKGIHPDGNTSVADAIKEYVAPPQRTWVGSGDLEDEIRADEREACSRVRAAKPKKLKAVGTGALLGEQQYCFEKGYKEGVASLRAATRARGNT